LVDALVDLDHDADGFEESNNDALVVVSLLFLMDS